MKKSENKKINDKLFYYTVKGKKPDGYFFFLPSISVSPTTTLNWNINVFSIFLSFGYYFLQINVCKKIRDESTTIQREHIETLIRFLKLHNLRFTDINKSIEFLQKNSNVLLLIKNSNLSHPYMKSILLGQFIGLPFVEKIDSNLPD